MVVKLAIMLAAPVSFSPGLLPGSEIVRVNVRELGTKLAYASRNEFALFSDFVGCCPLLLFGVVHNFRLRTRSSGVRIPRAHRFSLVRPGHRINTGDFANPRNRKKRSICTILCKVARFLQRVVVHALFAVELCTGCNLPRIGARSARLVLKEGKRELPARAVELWPPTSGYYRLGMTGFRFGGKTRCVTDLRFGHYTGEPRFICPSGLRGLVERGSHGGRVGWRRRAGRIWCRI
jgi:hypothetical protein